MRGPFEPLAPGERIVSVRTAIRAIAKKLPVVREIILECNRVYSAWVAIRKNVLYVPPGHFYSPIPSIDEVFRDKGKISASLPRAIPGVDLREPEQLRLLEDFLPFYSEIPFTAQKKEGLRYHFENPSFSYSDAVVLYCMIRLLQPKRIIEVGSGYSSCVTLDTNELFFGDSISITFIEPYPELLRSLLKESDRSSATILSSRLQDVDIAEFEKLGRNDILFVDSTHVAKFNSDVNRIFFEILPRLSPGVHVQFHDVFYPFEYPREWILEGRAWNELYLLRTFLQYNRAFEIVLMNTYMECMHEAFFKERMPLCLKNPGGSIWLRKVSD